MSHTYRTGRQAPNWSPPAHSSSGLDRLVLAGMGAFLTALFGASLYNAEFLPVCLAAGALLCVGVGVLRFPVEATVAWFVVAGTTPEMWLGDAVSGGASLLTALAKLVGLAMVAVCVIRYGICIDLLNPSFAYLFMFVVGFEHGLWPTLTPADSLRTLVGSAAPFAFSFSRLSLRWCRAVIHTTMWIPLVVVGFGALLAITGMRPLLADLGGGLRLEGSTHPAFLGAFAMAAIYAALVELYRDGRNRNIVALIVNFVILVATGARGPLASALLVSAVSFLGLRSTVFPWVRRLPLLLAGALLLPVLIVAASNHSGLRLLSVLSTEAGSLSGRGVIWPYFEAAWSRSPWFGWGVGAGKEIVDPDSLIAKLLGTTAAHNEYLRIGVEGGWIGLSLLVLMIAGWAWWWTRRMRRTSDQLILRVVFICFALHSITDNTLIAATATVLFAWTSAVFARARLEAEAADRRWPRASRRAPAIAAA